MLLGFTLELDNTSLHTAFVYSYSDRIRSGSCCSGVALEGRNCSFRCNSTRIMSCERLLKLFARARVRSRLQRRSLKPLFLSLLVLLSPFGFRWSDLGHVEFHLPLTVSYIFRGSFIFSTKKTCCILCCPRNVGGGCKQCLCSNF